jgi:hypothetical protein
MVVFWIGLGSCQPKPKEKLKPTFSSISRLIFVRKCALHTCHSPSFYHESGNLDLSDEKAYSRMVNINSHLYPDKFIIKPYDPDNSILINRLEGTVWAGVPLERSSLNDNERRIVREWVKRGAKCD